MTKPFEVHIAPEALAQLEKAPAEVREAAREMIANLRQAAQAFNDGRYKTIEDAIEAITGERPERIDD
jgi:hypothetical protein